MLQTSLASTVILPIGGMFAALAIKHFLADFALQTNWMARGKERQTGWFVPLLAHAGVHGAGLLIIVLATEPRLWWLAPVDLGIHGLIDRGKSLVSQATRWPMSDERFWWLLGFDQCLHQLCNVAFGLVLLAAILG